MLQTEDNPQYVETVPMCTPDASQSPSDRLRLAPMPTPPQTRQAMPARPQPRAIDALVLEDIAAIRWWFFVALFSSIVLLIGISLLMYQIV